MEGRQADCSARRQSIIFRTNGYFCGKRYIESRSLRRYRFLRKPPRFCDGLPILRGQHRCRERANSDSCCNGNCDRRDCDSTRIFRRSAATRRLSHYPKMPFLCASFLRRELTKRASDGNIIVRNERRASLRSCSDRRQCQLTAVFVFDLYYSKERRLRQSFTCRFFKNISTRCVLCGICPRLTS